ncbi:MAG TPA: LytR C-terminal domain-containing protein, partial [Solirubrobacteraceae bacterium]|nr:LytR C-terminal domain-containing protein [Solirubrobacteraceae bacterium]
TTPAASRQPGAPVARSSITVAVLNGTTTAGLAGALSAKLVGDGFVKGAIADATSQTAATTTVGYTKGNKVAAEEVARQLRISRASVVPVTSTNDATASSAGPHPQVVVTIGVQHPQ